MHCRGSPWINCLLHSFGLGNSWNSREKRHISAVFTWCKYQNQNWNNTHHWSFDLTVACFWFLLGCSWNCANLHFQSSGDLFLKSFGLWQVPFQSSLLPACEFLAQCQGGMGWWVARGEIVPYWKMARDGLLFAGYRFRNGFVSLFTSFVPKRLHETTNSSTV